jgi:hypothetical protein
MPDRAVASPTNVRLRLAVLFLTASCLCSSALAAGAATPTADYTVVFDATWSEATHPGAIPGNPHFSSLIGGLHNDQVSFWQLGGLASPGIERMAEQGGTSILGSEVNAAISAGTAEQRLNGGGVGTSPGSVSLDFTADDNFTLLTLVSMLAPSPDWFVGVDSLDLKDTGGEWRQQIVIQLYVYDAGTDSGTNFTSANQDTDPADPITLFDTGFFAPPMQYVGTYTITRTDLVDPVPGVGAGLPRGLLLISLAAVGAWLASRPKHAIH